MLTLRVGKQNYVDISFVQKMYKKGEEKEITLNSTKSKYGTLSLTSQECQCLICYTHCQNIEENVLHSRLKRVAQRWVVLQV